MKRLLTYATFLITATLSCSLASAADISGQSTGKFINPRGEENMMVSGVDTAFFRWGDETYQGNPYYWNIGDNWMKFEGNSFPVISETQFMIGRLTYFNGTTAPGTHATSVELKITLTFSDGTEKHFTFPYQLINTPNKSTRIEERADIVKFIQPFSENVITLDGQEYRLKLLFGRTTEKGFSAIDRFHVYEGEQASAEVQAVFTKEAPPPPVTTSRVQPNTDYDSFQQQHRQVQPTTLDSGEMDVSSWGAGRITSSQGSTTQQNLTNYNQFNQNREAQNPPSREVNVSRLPQTSGKLSAKTYEEFQAQRRVRDQGQNDAYAPPASSSYDSRRPSMRVNERSLTDPERRDWESHMPQSNPPVRTIYPKQEPIDLSDVGGAGEIPVPQVEINRAISLRFDTEPGYVYQIKTSHDGRDWTNIGDIIVGDGSEIIRVRELFEGTETKYKVEVSRSRNP